MNAPPTSDTIFSKYFYVEVNGIYGKVPGVTQCDDLPTGDARSDDPLRCTATFQPTTQTVSYLR